MKDGNMADYTVITENDESQWEDQTGSVYHFPNRYLRYLQPGTKVLYYKGKMKDKQFADTRLSADPHYFAVAEIGGVWPDPNSNKGDQFSEIIEFREFAEPVLAKQDGEYLEVVPAARITNYWRDGVRPIDEATYHRVLGQARLQTPPAHETNPNDRHQGDARAMESGVIDSHSWTVHSETVATKRMDRSSFLNRGSAVPAEIRPYFSTEHLEPGERKDIQLHLRGQQCKAHIEIDRYGRARLFWQSDLVETIRNLLPNWHNAYESGEEPETAARPTMRFERSQGAAVYEVGLICPDNIDRDVEAEIAEEHEPKGEGNAKTCYGKRYERDPKNRRDAIEIHGTICMACGFDFEDAYGMRGAGFVEVHHTKPLHLVGAEHPVDPKTDLVPLCANCHRMVHRRKDDVLSLEALRELMADHADLKKTRD